MYLGIDPGRQKFGWALGGAEGAFVASGIVPAEELEDFALKAARSCKGCEEWLSQFALIFVCNDDSNRIILLIPKLSIPKNVLV